jgi:hypothetical protein
MHAIPILFHVSTGIAGFPLEVYNPQGPRCWVGAYPPGCVDEDPHTCERGGDHEHLFGLYLVAVPYLIYTFFIVVALLIVAFTVWQKYRASRRFAFEQESTHLESQRIKMRMVLTQCALYGVYFLNITIWGANGTMMRLNGGSRYDFLGRFFLISVFGSTMYPSEGFFYFMIFIRPTYLMARKVTPESSRWSCILEAVLDPSGDAANKDSRASPSTNFPTNINEPVSGQFDESGNTTNTTTESSSTGVTTAVNMVEGMTLVMEEEASMTGSDVEAPIPDKT